MNVKALQRVDRWFGVPLCCALTAMRAVLERSSLWAGIACSPCVNAYNNRLSPCRNNLCMQAISVEQVFTAVCQAYEKRATPERVFPMSQETSTDLEQRSDQGPD